MYFNNRIPRGMRPSLENFYSDNLSGLEKNTQDAFIKLVENKISALPEVSDESFRREPKGYIEKLKELFDEFGESLTKTDFDATH